MITILGAANVDIQAFVSRKLVSGDSSPGRISTSAGGVARNIAHNLRSLGEEVNFITALATDENSQILKSNLRDLGIDYSASLIVPHGRTSSYVCILDENGALFGAVNDMEILESLTSAHIAQALSSLEKGSLVIADTNLQTTLLQAIASETKKAGAHLVIDTVSSTKCVHCAPILSSLYAIKPNKAEAYTLSGIEVTDTSSARKASLFFHDTGIKYVCISLGKEGVFYSSTTDYGIVSIAALPVVNVSGAGDALTAGFVSSLAKGYTIKEAALFGQSCASITCASEKTVSELLTFSYAQKIAQNISVQIIEGDLHE